MIRLNHIILSLSLLLLVTSCGKDEPKMAATESEFPPLNTMYGTIDSNNFNVSNISVSVSFNYQNQHSLSITARKENTDEIISLSFYPFKYESQTYDLQPTHIDGNQFLTAQYRNKQGNTFPALTGTMSIYSFNDSIARGFYDFTTLSKHVIKGRFTAKVR